MNLIYILIIVFKNMKSYKSSKWYIKTWRKRYYIIIPFIFIKENIFKIDIIDLFLFQNISNKELINSWFDIKKHIDLTKLHKYS